jgi:hypothetical protein
LAGGRVTKNMGELPAIYRQLYLVLRIVVAHQQFQLYGVMRGGKVQNDKNSKWLSANI